MASPVERARCAQPPPSQLPWRAARADLRRRTLPASPAPLRRRGAPRCWARPPTLARCFATERVSVGLPIAREVFAGVGRRAMARESSASAHVHCGRDGPLRVIQEHAARDNRLGSASLISSRYPRRPRERWRRSAVNARVSLVGCLSTASGIAHSAVISELLLRSADMPVRRWRQRRSTQRRSGAGRAVLAPSGVTRAWWRGRFADVRPPRSRRTDAPRGRARRRDSPRESDEAWRRCPTWRCGGRSRTGRGTRTTQSTAGAVVLQARGARGSPERVARAGGVPARVVLAGAADEVAVGARHPCASRVAARWRLGRQRRGPARRTASFTMRTDPARRREGGDAWRPTSHTRRAGGGEGAAGAGDQGAWATAGRPAGDAVSRCAGTDYTTTRAAS